MHFLAYILLNVYICIIKLNDMAKYNITYKCGHTDTISLYGPIKERENKIEWLSNNLCPACKRQIALDRAKQNAAMLPKLQGSDKQVEWAMVIRQQWLDEAREWLTGKGFDFEKAKDNMLDDYLKNKDKYDKCEERNSPISTRWRFLTALIEDSAVFFINNR